MIEYRNAQVAELPLLRELLWKYGPNQWNYLTEQGVEDEMALIKSGHAVAEVAVHNEQIIGFAVLIEGTKGPDYLSQYCAVEQMCFIGDVVVSSSYAGQGIATQLLINCLGQAEKKHARVVLIERHEENLASAGMMKKAGFCIIDKFYDPDKRESGSRCSVILQKDILPE